MADDDTAPQFIIKTFDNNKFKDNIIPILSSNIFKKNIFNIENNTISLQKIIISSINKSEILFNKGYELILDDQLPESQIKDILARLAANRPLTPTQRAQVITAQEFYAAKANVFLERAKQTADTPREVRYIKAILTSYNAIGPILDAGCGLGRLTIPLIESKLNAYGIDVSQTLIEIAKRKNPQLKEKFQVRSIYGTNFPVNSFSAVLLMWHVITEVHENLEAVFREINRILKLQGIVVFDFPDVTSDLTKLYYKPDPESEEDFSKFLIKVPAAGTINIILEKTGFKLVRLKRFKFGIHKFVGIAVKK